MALGACKGGVEAGNGNAASACAPSYGAGWAVATGNSTASGISAVAAGAHGDVGFAGAVVQDRDATGALLWNDAVSATRIVPIADGGFYIAGDAVGDAGLFAPSVMRLDGNGGTVWSQTVGPIADFGQSFLAADPAGGVWILGTQVMTPSDPGFNNPGLFGVFLARLDPNGNLMWSEMLGELGMNYARGIAVGPSGAAFVALQANGGPISLGDLDDGGYSWPSPIVASIGRDGTVTWAQVISPMGDQNDQVTALALGVDGTVYAAGTSDLPEAIGTSLMVDAFVTALSEDGEIQWRQLYSDYPQMGGPLLATRPCGGLVLAAATSDPANPVVVLDLDNSGDEQRRRLLSCVGGAMCVVIPTDLIAHGGDGVVMTGRFWGAPFAFDTITLGTTLSLDSFIARIAE
jgi:hypothetical protein